MDHKETIQKALEIANISGFDGEFTALGGGEVNDTFKIDLADRQIIIRIARDKGQNTLKAEASSLQLLSSVHIPKFIYFDETKTIDDHMWILEGFISGHIVKRLSPQQFYSLGKLLAQVHMVSSTDYKISLRRQFIDVCKLFGNEEYLLNHPDKRLRKLIVEASKQFEEVQSSYDNVVPSIIHSDATPSNILVNGGEVGLIDWEFSKYSDPMCDFSTIYYEDIEYNKGKWRIKISDEEKQSLFAGYEAAGGHIDEDRIRFWIKFDKLGALVFLYWRINQSTRATSQEESKQYQLDYDNILNSLLA